MSWDSGPKVTEEELREALRTWGNEYTATYKLAAPEGRYSAAIGHAREDAKSAFTDERTAQNGFYFTHLADLLELARRVDLEELAKEASEDSAAKGARWKVKYKCATRAAGRNFEEWLPNEREFSSEELADNFIQSHIIGNPHILFLFSKERVEA